MADLEIEGMALAEGVLETIVSIAATEVEGVAGLAGGQGGGILSAIKGKPATGGIQVQRDEEGTLAVEVHIDAQYGTPLPEVAANLRQAVADAALTQVGLEVGRVDVFVDGIKFE